jgi:hypothetical protein
MNAVTGERNLNLLATWELLEPRRRLVGQLLLHAGLKYATDSLEQSQNGAARVERVFFITHGLGKPSALRNSDALTFCMLEAGSWRRYDTNDETGTCQSSATHGTARFAEESASAPRVHKTPVDWSIRAR